MKGNSGFESVLISGGSEDVTTMDTQTQTVVVPSGHVTPVYFPIVPKTIGNVDIEVSARTGVAADAVKRQLRVKVGNEVLEHFNMTPLFNLKWRKFFSRAKS